MPPRVSGLGKCTPTAKKIGTCPLRSEARQSMKPVQISRMAPGAQVDLTATNLYQPPPAYRGLGCGAVAEHFANRVDGWRGRSGRHSQPGYRRRGNEPFPGADARRGRDHTDRRVNQRHPGQRTPDSISRCSHRGRARRGSTSTSAASVVIVLVVENTQAIVFSVHGSVRASSAQPPHRSTTMSPPKLTASDAQAFPRREIGF